MTISTSIDEKQYPGNGTADTFAYPFKITAEDDLQVALINDTTGTRVVQTISTHYSVAGVGDNAGGNVVFVTEPASGQTVDIRRVVDYSQTSDFRNQGSFFPESHEDAFDRLEMQIQQLARAISRAIKADDFAAIPVFTLPNEVTRAGKYMVFAANGDVELAAALPSGTLSQSVIGQYLNPTTAAETSAGVTPTNFQNAATPTYDLVRIGLVPNSTGARAANSAAIIALLDPAVSGPRGRFIFPNTTGADTYYFAALPIEIRDGCGLDLNGCTLHMGGAFTSALELHAFLSGQRGVEICNGTITVDYDGSAGTNNGMVLRIGARGGYSFGGVAGVDEEGFTTPMSRCWLHDLKITTNNPGPTVAIALYGGLHNPRVERIEGDLGGIVEGLIYYEFGEYHYEAAAANQTTTHAINLVIDQITGKNLKSDGLVGAVVEVVGANSATVSRVHGDGCSSVLIMRCGEALFYNVGAPYVIGGRTRWHKVSGITGQNITSHGVSLSGSETNGGYLSGESLTDSDLCDLQGFVVDGVSIDSSFYCNGPLVMNGGTLRGAGGSGGLIIGADCLSAEIFGTQILDGAAAGIRADIADSVRGSPRKKHVVIEGAKIAGNVGQAVLIDDCESGRVTNCDLGYSTARGDVGNESTQTAGVSLGADASGVQCSGNFVAVAGGGTAYVSAGSGDRGNNFTNTRGARNTSGNWQVDGMAIVSGTALADVADIINTADKYTYKKIIQNSDNRIYFALGAAAADGWRLADGSATVTPA